jgi:Predicted phosphohydrolases
MYKLLIIDDEIKDREELYNEVLGEHFNITLSSNEEKEIRDFLNDNFYDGIILDSTMTSGTVAAEVVKILNEFPRPIIVVSDKRIFNDSDRKNKNVIDCISIRLLLKIRNGILNKEENFPYSLEDYHALKEDMVQRIRHSIRLMTGYSDVQDNKKFTILHISDIQFDDPHGIEFDLNLLFTKITKHVNGRNVIPDIVCISGNIAFTGSKKEYDHAKEPILRFLKAIYKDDYYKHVFIVPGNHDINYNSYKSERNDSILTEEIDINKNIVPSMFKKFVAPNFSHYYFSEFAYELTKNVQYWRSPFLVENGLSIPYGFQLIGINNSMIYHLTDLTKKSKRYEFEIKSFEIEKIITNKEKPTILVGHISPIDLGYENVCAGSDELCNKNFKEQCGRDGKCRKWGMSDIFMNAYNVIIYLFGHQHYSSNEISNDSKRLFIGAGTPSGVNKNEMSFNIIEIDNSKGEEIVVKIINNSVGSSEVELKKVESFKYINEKWEILKK